MLNPRDISKATLDCFSPLYYTPEDKRWLHHNGYFYEDYTNDLRGVLLQAVVEVARLCLDLQIGATDNKVVEGLLRKRKYSFSSASFPHELESLLRDMSLISSEEFDADSTVLGCFSGVLDRIEAHPTFSSLGTIQWLPHDPARLITRCIPIYYDPAAECPEWLGLLGSSIGDSGDRLQVMLGFAFGGDNTKKKRIVNLVGPTDTGKSTVLDTLSSILAPYLGVMRTEEIVVSRHNSKFDFHGLRNSRAVFLSEPDQHSRFRIGELKRVTGGEEIATEGKGSAPVRWRASVMPFIGTNYEITFDTTDDAFVNRTEYIYFNRTRPIDRELKRKLMAERQGIFNWILHGILRYFNGELDDTPQSLQSRLRAIIAVEPPLQFISYALENDHIHPVGNDFPAYKCCRVNTLYEQYKEWHRQEHGDKSAPYGRKRFSEVIQKQYPKNDRAKAGYWTFSGIAPGSGTK